MSTGSTSAGVGVLEATVVTGGFWGLSSLFLVATLRDLVVADGRFGICGDMGM